MAFCDCLNACTTLSISSGEMISIASHRSWQRTKAMRYSGPSTGDVFYASVLDATTATIAPGASSLHLLLQSGHVQACHIPLASFALAVEN